jgi:hypothetical protein
VEDLMANRDEQGEATIRPLGSADDADAVVVRMEGIGALRVPRFWETPDGIDDVGRLLGKLNGSGSAEEDAARARLMEILAEVLTSMGRELRVKQNDDA